MRSLIALIVGYLLITVMSLIGSLVILAVSRGMFEGRSSASVLIFVSLASTLTTYALPAIITGMISRKDGFLHGLVLFLILIILGLIMGNRLTTWWIGPLVMIECLLGGAFGSFIINRKENKAEVKADGS